MAATAQPPATPSGDAAPRGAARAEGVELLGPLDGSGHEGGASLVRRADGQVVQVGAMMYALLEELDGRRDGPALVEAMREKLGRPLELEHVERLAQKLYARGLIAGSEHHAPAKSNPLLGLRWKVLITDPEVTDRLTKPFMVFFKPWVVWPVLAAFAATLWVVLMQEGVAGATSEAFKTPELLLLVFGLGIASAGFHELGHAAAARYGGSRPGGMGAGIYMVWPAFYTDVTDSYRLPRRDRLRVDLGGLHFNALVSVLTMAAWLATGVDALLLLIGLQVLQMVKQLSPVIRADGYHVLADLTGVPDLYAHMGPTLKRLIPGREREPSALTGRARAIVTVWVLVTVPMLLSLMLGVVLLLPKLLATVWDSGSDLISGLPDEGFFGVVLTLLRLVALTLPLLGSVLLVQKLLRGIARKAWGWSAGSAVRRAVVTATAGGAIATAAWALWPAGQYEPIRATQGGTLTDLGRLVSSPADAARPDAAAATQPVRVKPGKRLAITMVPRGGATKENPAVIVLRGEDGERDVAVLSDKAPGIPKADRERGSGAPAAAAAAAAAANGTPSAPPAAPAPTQTTPATAAAPADAPASEAGVAFPFDLPEDPGPGGTQALAVNTEDGGVVYDIAYAVVTIEDGDPVTNTNSAFALASCEACTTVAVSFQVVLVVGSSDKIAPINAAGAVNVDCPSCMTTALAYQLVLTLDEAPSEELVRRLEEELKALDALPSLGAGADLDDVLAEVQEVRDRVQAELDESGVLPEDEEEEPASTTATTPTTTSTTPATSTPTTPTTPAQTTPAPAAPAQTTPAPTQTAPAQTTPAQTTPTTTAPAPTTTTPPAKTTPAPARTTTAPAAPSGATTTTP